MSELDFALTEVFAAKPMQGARVAVVPDADALDTAAMLTMARSLGQPFTAFVVSPRRDDCHRRVRVFTPVRELPLSLAAAFAAMVVTGGIRDRMRIEQGVIALEVTRDEDDRMQVALPRPVSGTIAMPDPLAVAEALSLPVEALSTEMPIVAGNAGMLSLLVPVVSEAALGEAWLAAGAWRRVIEKAKVLGALVYTLPKEGTVRARFLAPFAGVAEWPCEPSVAASLLGALMAYGQLAPGEPTATLTVAHDTVAGQDARVNLVYEGRGDRDGAVVVTGVATRHATGTWTLPSS